VCARAGEEWGAGSVQKVRSNKALVCGSHAAVCSNRFPLPMMRTLTPSLAPPPPSVSPNRAPPHTLRRGGSSGVSGSIGDERAGADGADGAVEGMSQEEAMGYLKTRLSEVPSERGVQRVWIFYL